MRLEIRHSTVYRYEAPLTRIVQRLHLTPMTFSSQRVLQWAIHAPNIERALVYRDWQGNTVHLLAAQGVLGDQVTVTAEGVVEVDDALGVVQGVPKVREPAIYLRSTPATAVDEGLAALAAAARDAAPDTLGRLHALMDLVHGTIRYEPGATHAHTTAAEALRDRQGVCQDHAHVFLAAARHLGIPARYVSGYLVLGQGASATASHAWAEGLVPDLGWVGFDAANNLCPNHAYVRLAAGMDATAVAPVRGVQRGGRGETMTVDVSVLEAGQ